jgi:hypothetical protein
VYEGNDPRVFASTAFAPEAVAEANEMAYVAPPQFDSMSLAGARIDREFIADEADELITTLDDLNYIKPAEAYRLLQTMRDRMLENRRKAMNEGRVA